MNSASSKMQRSKKQIKTAMRILKNSLIGFAQNPKSSPVRSRLKCYLACAALRKPSKLTKPPDSCDPIKSWLTKWQTGIKRPRSHDWLYETPCQKTEFKGRKRAKNCHYRGKWHGKSTFLKSIIGQIPF